MRMRMHSYAHVCSRMLALARILQAIYSSGIEDAGAKFGAKNKKLHMFAALRGTKSHVKA